uniref:Uncharacterized protein n=1 Tax=Arundo donax TaxID=35708 RepID=A0A0A8YS34_ARUDO
MAMLFFGQMITYRSGSSSTKHHALLVVSDPCTGFSRMATDRFIHLLLF